jgi:hypothetical protein
VVQQLEVRSARGRPANWTGRHDDNEADASARCSACPARRWPAASPGACLFCVPFPLLGCGTDCWWWGAAVAAGSVRQLAGGIKLPQKAYSALRVAGCSNVLDHAVHRAALRPLSLALSRSAGSLTVGAGCSEARERNCSTGGAEERRAGYSKVHPTRTEEQGLKPATAAAQHLQPCGKRMNCAERGASSIDVGTTSDRAASSEFARSGAWHEIIA